MNDRTLLVHLGGYASITAVLATANWAGLSAILLALPIVLATLWLGGALLTRYLVDRAKAGMDRPAPTTSTATDGGTEQRHRTTDSDRKRSQNQ